MQARWYRNGPETDTPRLFAAIKQLETAALIGRIPRAAVLPYVQLATAALWILQDEVELRGDPEYAGLDMQVSDAVLDAAEIISKAAWSSPATRWVWLWLGVRRVGRKAAAIEDPRLQRKIESARRYVR